MAQVMRSDRAASEPVRQTAARIMAVIRAGEAIALVPAAVATGVPPVSLNHLAPALAVFAVWAGVYAWTATVRGLVTWLIVVDVALTVLICLLNGWIVPIERIGDGSGWVATVASLCVVGLPLAWRAWLSVPSGLLVVAAFVAGYRLAGHPELGQQHAAVMAGQLAVSAVVMAMVRRTSSSADAALAAAHEERRRSAVSQARRLDEGAQLRLLHDTALTTLTLVGTGAIVRSDSLARQAAADVAAVERIAAPSADVDEGPVPLQEILADAAERHDDRLSVRLLLTSCRVPAVVGAAFAGAVHEALSNSIRHSGTDRAAITLSMRDGEVVVEVSDDGHGFEVSDAPVHRYGVRKSIVARMAEVGGRATVKTASGIGTRWTLEWCDAGRD